MAFGSKGAGGSVGSATANQASITLTTATTNLAAGDLGVIIVCGDNNQTGDGDEGMVTSVTDSAGNGWVKAVEFCNGQGSAQAGSTCSMWFTNAKAALNTGGTITANLSNAASRDAMCLAAWYYTKAAGTVAARAFSATLANDAADPGSLNVTTLNKEYLRIRGISSELNSVTAITVTATWTSWALTVRSSNAAAAQTARAEHIISTATSAASDPTYASADHASVYAAFEELLPAGYLETPMLAWRCLTSARSRR